MEIFRPIGVNVTESLFFFLQQNNYNVTVI